MYLLVQVLWYTPAQNKNEPSNLITANISFYPVCSIDGMRPQMQNCHT